MQVGDLVIDTSLGNRAIGMIVCNGFYTDLGTPFDWGVFYFVTGTYWVQTHIIWR